MRHKVYIFDFDGTLTTRDTLLLFIRFVCGRWGFVAVFLRYAPLLVLMKLKLYPNWRVKQKVFAHCFGGMTTETFNDYCCSFARKYGSCVLRPKGFATVRKALDEGATVMIVSASVDNWVRPFFDDILTTLSNPTAFVVLGTEVEAIDGILTGQFKSRNCYGAEKVRRLSAQLPAPREDCYIVAFGDSRGDKEMLQYADEAHYKPFRR
jgi:Haloacid Dehalogenase superfamily, subfamily IB, phosphoserine phosphatase-like